MYLSNKRKEIEEPCAIVSSKRLKYKTKEKHEKTKYFENMFRNNMLEIAETFTCDNIQRNHFKRNKKKDFISHHDIFEKGDDSQEEDFFITESSQETEDERENDDDDDDTEQKRSVLILDETHISIQNQCQEFFTHEFLSEPSNLETLNFSVFPRPKKKEIGKISRLPLDKILNIQKESILRKKECTGYNLASMTKCTSKLYAKKLCRKHYDRLRRHKNKKNPQNIFDKRNRSIEEKKE